MGFFAIMIVGTVIAVWAVAGSRPAQRVYPTEPPVLDLPQYDPGTQNAESWQWEPTNDLEYVEAMARHDRDPIHNPFPSPPPKIRDDFF